MDDSMRAEYQRRLDEGDKQGALSYLRLLRTQTDDDTARGEFTQAIDRIERGDDMAVAQQGGSTYHGSVGPFGDAPATDGHKWERATASEPAPSTASPSWEPSSSAPSVPAFSPGGSGFVPVPGSGTAVTGSPSFGDSSPAATAPAPAAPAASASGESAPSHPARHVDPISEAIGNLQRGIHDRFTGHHDSHTAQESGKKMSHEDKDSDESSF
ncbi:MAG TPA: hypothetical protein VM536_18955 [Chloroflexia bacterium]|nr:hypothetical protein [Chloroflexia bacterium]